MTQVTVCLPAFRSERFIAFTLAALKAQTFRDFRVHIAVEPVEEGPTVDACRPFLEDERFDLTINAEQLGWDRNVQAMLGEVRTPFFAVQPHDDVPQPRYLESLLRAVAARPDASVAYSDIYLFGAQVGRRSMDVPDAQRSVRELGFFLAGAEGHPFRGVTRSSVLHRPFPTNEFSGFACETEWALHLVGSGSALRVAEPLYLKRARARDSGSVTSGWRFRMPPERLIAALEHNRARLIGAIGEAEPSGVPRALVELAAEAAMLRRWQVLSGGRLPFGPEQLDRADRVVRESAMSDVPEAKRISAMAHVALSRHWQALEDRRASLVEARAAAQDAPLAPEVCVRLAQLLNTLEGVDEMVAMLSRAAAAAPLDAATLLLAADAARTLARRYGVTED